MIVCRIPDLVIMSVFLILSARVVPRIDLRHLISKTVSFLVSSDFRVHVSETYVAIGSIRAL